MGFRRFTGWGSGGSRDGVQEVHKPHESRTHEETEGGEGDGVVPQRRIDQGRFMLLVGTGVSLYAPIAIKSKTNNMSKIFYVIRYSFSLIRCWGTTCY